MAPQARLCSSVEPDVNKLLPLARTMEEEVQRFFEEAIPAAPVVINCHLCGNHVSWDECQHFGLASKGNYSKVTNHLEEYRIHILPQVLDEYEPIERNGGRFVHISLTRHMAFRDTDINARNERKKRIAQEAEKTVERHLSSIPLFPVFLDIGDMELMGKHVFLFLESLNDKLGQGETETTLMVAFGSSSQPSIAFQTGYYHYTKLKRPNWKFFQLNLDIFRTIKGKRSVGYHAHPDPNMLFQDERSKLVSEEDYKGLLDKFGILNKQLEETRANYEELSDKFGILNEQLEETRAKLKMINEISDLDSIIQESE